MWYFWLLVFIVEEVWREVTAKYKTRRLSASSRASAYFHPARRRADVYPHLVTNPTTTNAHSRPDTLTDEVATRKDVLPSFRRRHTLTLWEIQHLNDVSGLWEATDRKPIKASSLRAALYEMRKSVSGNILYYRLVPINQERFLELGGLL